MKNRLAVIVGILTLTFFALGTAIGQDNNQVQGQVQGQGEEPSSSVARISLMHGDVSTQRGDSSDWTAAVLNQPVLASDKVSTGVGSPG